MVIGTATAMVIGTATAMVIGTAGSNDVTSFHLWECMIEMIMDQQRATTAQQTHHFILLSPDQSPSLSCSHGKEEMPVRDHSCGSCCHRSLLLLFPWLLLRLCLMGSGSAHLSQVFDVILQMRRRKMEWRIPLERKVFGWFGGMQSSEEMVKEKSESFRKNLATTQRKQERHSGIANGSSLKKQWKISGRHVCCGSGRHVCLSAARGSERGRCPSKTPLFLRDTSPHPSLLTLLQLDMGGGGWKRYQGQHVRSWDES
jgi:hypothetical protein